MRAIPVLTVTQTRLFRPNEAYAEDSKELSISTTAFSSFSPLATLSTFPVFETAFKVLSSFLVCLKKIWPYILQQLTDLGGATVEMAVARWKHKDA